MMKQLRKVFSILCAIALLLSSMANALAEETDPAEEAAAQAAVEETAVEAPAAEEPAASEPAAAEPAVEAPAPEAPAAEEPAAVEPAPEAPAAEAPAAEEPAAEEPAAEEPAAVEPAAVEPAVEQPAAEEPAVEEPAAEEPAAEEPAAEEPASDNNEETDNEEDDGLVELDDGWGYIDQEVIEENTPEITDELKGIRNAELTVGEMLAETIDFGEELVITLKDSGASTVDLKLYVPSGASINTKVDGKAVGFTPAESDVPSMDLYTYELANAAGRSHDIVLSSYDTVSFMLSAVVSQAETVETPAAEENTPAETPAGDTPASETPAETPAPTIQVSVKTYDALKVGNNISDTLIAGQKAKIQVKCGKHLNVVLTLNANPDDAVVTIDGTEAQFVSAGNGTYICELNDVAFRKFNVVISAKQELAFTLSSAAGETAEETPAAEEVTETKEENAEDINKEETETETSEEVTEETEQPAEETEEAGGEEVTEETEETTEEPAEETEEEAEEGTEEETEEAEEETEETEEETEETEEETEETEETVIIEHLTDEQLAELGYRKVQVLNKDGADIYDSIEEEAAVIGHADFESELWIKDTEAEGWAEIYTAKEKKVVKAAVEEEPAEETASEEETAEETVAEEPAVEEATAEETAAEETAVEEATEENKKFVRLADVDGQMTFEEQMLADGYWKAQVALADGADVYNEMDINAEAVDHLDVGTEIWVKIYRDTGWAEIYTEEENEPEQFIRYETLIITLKPDDEDDLTFRSVTATTSLEGVELVYYGTPVTLEAHLEGFLEDDVYTVQWKYSPDDGETYYDIEEANELQYVYVIDEENFEYRWKIVITLFPKE